MPVWETVRHQVAIAGRITDGSTEKPLAGASVTIQSAVETVATLITRQDGHYHVMDLPDGVYTVTASLPTESSRYGTAQTTAKVARTPQNRIMMAIADLTLPPTTIQGTLTAGGNPVFMAEIRLQGSAEKTFSEQDGSYRITGVEIGNRTLIVTARGCGPASQAVALVNAGEVVNVDFTLSNS
jgi:hypothetical protein